MLSMGKLENLTLIEFILLSLTIDIDLVELMFLAEHAVSVSSFGDVDLAKVNSKKGMVLTI